MVFSSEAAGFFATHIHIHVLHTHHKVRLHHVPGHTHLRVRHSKEDPLHIRSPGTHQQHHNFHHEPHHKEKDAHGHYHHGQHQHHKHCKHYKSHAPSLGDGMPYLAPSSSSALKPLANGEGANEVDGQIQVCVTGDVMDKSIRDAHDDIHKKQMEEHGPQMGADQEACECAATAVAGVHGPPFEEVDLTSPQLKDKVAAAEMREMQEMQDMAHQHEAIYLKEKVLPSKPEGVYIPRRYLYAALNCVGLTVMYMMRVAPSVAVVPMQKEFNWSEETASIFLSSFYFGYIINQVTASNLANRFGGKWVFAIGMTLATVFTFLTPVLAEANFGLLVIARLLVGLGQACGYPSSLTLASRWIPREERSTTVAAILSGSSMGTIFSFLFSGIIVKMYSWQMVFYIYGILGIIWLVLWVLLTASYPSTHRFIAKEEKEFIENSLYSGGSPPKLTVPWKKILSSSAVWGSIFAYFSVNWCFYIFLSYIPKYLMYAFKFDLSSSGGLACIPYVCLVLVNVCVGKAADYFITKKKTPVVIVRKTVQTIGCLLPAAFLIALNYSPSVEVGVLFLTLAVGLSGFTYSGVSVNGTDIAPKYAGVIMGLQNTAGTIPGIVAVYLTGWMIHELGSWSYVFYTAACVYVAGTIVFLIFAKGTPVVD